MTSSTRKFFLTTHVVSSVGWLGAVAAFLALSVVGVNSSSADTVRAAYVAMNVVGQFTIVPLSIAALLTGIVQSYGTPWGLVRYYWVFVKFLLTLIATSLLLLHQFTAVAGAASRALTAAPGVMPHVGRLGGQLLFDAAAATVLLIATTVLSIYKPWGRITVASKIGEGNPASSTLASSDSRTPTGVRVLVVILGVIVATVVIVHLAAGGLHHH